MQYKVKLLTIHILLGLSTLVYAQPGERENNDEPDPVYKTVYILKNTNTPFQYQDEFGQIQNKYPTEALAYLYMNGATVFNGDTISGIANFVFNNRNYTYKREQLPEGNHTDVTYRYLSGRLNGGDMNEAASITGEESMKRSQSADRTFNTKNILLNYLNEKRFQTLNFDYEQQFNYSSCSLNDADVVCEPQGKRRLQGNFKLNIGQNIDDTGTFYGTQVEYDPDDGVTTEIPDSEKPTNTLDVKYYANNPFIDFYMDINNINTLAPYEPLHDNNTIFNNKIAVQYSGWFDATVTDTQQKSQPINVINNAGISNFYNVLPIDSAIIPDVNGNATAYDLADRYRYIFESLKNNKQCFFPEGENTDCNLDVKQMMLRNRANKLNLTEISPFILDKAQQVNSSKVISYDYCLSPLMNENVKANVSVKQYGIVKKYQQNDGGQIQNVTEVKDVIPQVINTLNLPAPLIYDIKNFAFTRNKSIGQYITDDVYKNMLFDFTKASLYDDNGQITIGKHYFMQPSDNMYVNSRLTGNMDTAHQWSCDESFSAYVNNFARGQEQTCGGASNIAGINLSGGSSQCSATLTLRDTCETKERTETQTVANPDGTTSTNTYTTTYQEWTSQHTDSIGLPAGGVPCQETCNVGEGPKTIGYCTWREESTGRKYITE